MIREVCADLFLGEYVVETASAKFATIRDARDKVIRYCMCVLCNATAHTTGTTSREYGQRVCRAQVTSRSSSEALLSSASLRLHEEMAPQWRELAQLSLVL